MKHHDDELEKAIHKPTPKPPIVQPNDSPDDGDGGGPPTKPDPKKP